MSTFLLSFKKTIFALVLIFMTTWSINATTYYTAANGAPENLVNWWTGAAGTGTHPANFTTSGDIFIIQNNHIMTTLGNWSFGNPAGGAMSLIVNGTLAVNSGNVLTLNQKNKNPLTVTVNGIIIFSDTSNNQMIGSIAGSAGAVDVVFNLASGATLKTVNVNGIQSLANNTSINATKLTCNLNTGANYEFNGSAAQATSGLPATVNNLIFSGSGAKSISSATSVTANLSISGATVSIGTGLNISVGTLTLGGKGTNSGANSWGSTLSAATYKNNTYFAATNGTVSVVTDTRATPTVTPTIGTYVYTGVAQGPNSATNSGTTSSYTYSYVGVSGTTYGPGATRPVNAGSYNVTVSIAVSADGFYKAATSSATLFTINKVTPAVSVSPSATAITFGQTLASSTLSGGTASVSGSYTFTTPSTAPSAGTASQGVTFTPTDIANYNTTTTTASVTVNQAPQVITFGTIADRVVGDDAITLPGAIQSSGLPITYVSSDPAVVSVFGSTLTILKAGTTIITASQAGSGNYSAASNVSRNLTVLQACTWDGNNWTPGAPSLIKEAIIVGDYNTMTYGGFTAKKLTVNSGKFLTVNSGTNLTVVNEVVNLNVGATAATAIVIENNANLIQVNDVANSGAITVKRNSNELKRLDYTIWSSPVFGTQRLYDFSPATSTNRFYVYNPLSDEYVTILNGAYFTPGKGYLIRMPNSNAAVPGYSDVENSTAVIYNGIFKGTPNNGNIDITLDLGYNAIGNPYPSTIDADKFLDANSSIEGTLYFYRKTNGSTGSSYATYTLAGGTGTGGTDTSATPNGIIQAGQGFVVKATGSGLLTFTNVMRTDEHVGPFFKTKKSTVERNRIWLNLTNTTGVFSQALVGYMTNATQGVDNGIDGKYINDSKIALTSAVNNEEYTIQGRALPFDPSDVVPLNFKTDKAGDYTIAIDHTDGLFATGQDVYLVDNVTGIETDLKAGGYAFTAPAGTTNARFSLKYQKTLGVNAAAFNENNVVVYKDKGIVYVNSGNIALANVKVYDIQGKLLAELKDLKSTSATINTLKDVQEVLIVKATTQDSALVANKIVN